MVDTATLGITVTVLSVSHLATTGQRALVIRAVPYLAAWAALIILGPTPFFVRRLLTCRRAAAWPTHNARRLALSAGSSASTTLGGQFAVIMLAAASPALVAGYRLLQTLFGPISPILSALALSCTERLVKSPVARRPVMAGALTEALWATTAPVTTALLLFGPERFPSESWKIAQTAILPFSLLMLVLQFNHGLQLILRNASGIAPIFVSDVIGGIGYVLAVATRDEPTLPSVLLAIAGLQIPAIAHGALSAYLITRRECAT